MSDKSYTDNLDQAESGQMGDLPSSNGAEHAPAAGDSGNSGKSEISLIGWEKEPGRSRTARKKRSGRGHATVDGSRPVRRRNESSGRTDNRSEGGSSDMTGAGTGSNRTGSRGAGGSVRTDNGDKTGSRSGSSGRTGRSAGTGNADKKGNRTRATAKRGAGKGKGVPSHRRRFRRKLRRFLPVILAGIIAVFLLFLIISGVRAVVRRIIPDRTPPVIELTRKADYFVDSPEEYEEEGYTASDDRDGDLTDKVTVSVTENTICYRVSDRAGNIAQEYREIPLRETGTGSGDGTGETGGRQKGTYVSDLKNVEPASVPDTKVIYLTFDDGPGEYTEHLLDILDHYGVHVTFFVTGAFPYYEDMIKKEYEAGHSIGVHTFSHDFEKIYSSDKAFWDDIEKMEKIIEKQTGRRTSLMRFAGGSSNTMSADYTPGIMTLLTQQAEKKGMYYFDWNVSSGDGAANPIGEEVVNKIISQVQNNDYSVVLCHDTKESTVNNIEYVIAWALENGYTFLPLDETSTTAHHAILN